jgi:pimeloyl-ACP methyl ester carboxylesterase
MKSIYKSAEGERAIRERYIKFLQYWPVPNQQLRIPTREGETFVIACGSQEAPALVLLHGASGNAAMWMADVRVWSQHFRVYAVDVIGDAGLSALSRPPLHSDTHALWLDDVLGGLQVERASFIGVSNGGWMALDYATRRPERVESLVVLCPGGVVRARNILLKVFPLLLLRKWGARKIREKIVGKTPAGAPESYRHFADFITLIFQHLRPRTERHPIITGDQLRSLKMPMLAILGGKDVILDSAAIERRLKELVPRVEVRMIPEAGHFIPGQTQAICDFLTDKSSTGALEGLAARAAQK